MKPPYSKTQTEFRGQETLHTSSAEYYGNRKRQLTDQRKTPDHYSKFQEINPRSRTRDTKYLVGAATVLIST